MMRVMKSQYERIKYLKSVNDAYDNTISLLNDSTNMAQKYAKEASQDKARIAKDILDYIKYVLNMSMQNVRNCCLRVSYIDKIKAHFDSLDKELVDLDPSNVTNVQRLAKEVSLYKQCAWEYGSKCRSGSARAMSKAYSMLIKQEGVTFPQLVDRHKNKLGIVGVFCNLDGAKMLKVYNGIIEFSRRAKIPKLAVASKAVGISVLMVAAGIMVWDIFTAENTIEAVLRNSLRTFSEIGGFVVKVAVKAAATVVTTKLSSAVLAVSMAGFVVGMLAGFLFVTACGLLIDFILGTGGNSAPPVTDLKFHTAQMPDGMAFANQIAYNS